MGNWDRFDMRRAGTCRERYQATADLSVFRRAALYLAAPYYSLLSIRGQELQPVVETPRPTVRENWIARWAVALVLGMLAGVVISQLLPAPATQPGYARFQPPDVPVRRLVGLPPALTRELPTATELP